MTNDTSARKERRDFQIALILGGIAFAIAIAFVLWVKQQAPEPIAEPKPSSASTKR